MEILRVPFKTLVAEMERVLLKIGFAPDRAEICARVFSENSRDGVASHGLNRFPPFIRFIEKGYIDIHAQAKLVAAFGAFEQWDGHSGPGIPNALDCANRAIEIARQQGIGCVAIKNTNHWMRGGTYGRIAAEAGCAMICWTNTLPNMPPWGARECKHGNNPLVIAVPRRKGPVVLDMAMTQFSYGKMETLKAKCEMLPMAGGFDKAGNLTNDPSAILESQLGLPIGYWKGSGLALLLNILSSLLSGGLATHQIGQQPTEYNVSQMFIVFDTDKTGGPNVVNGIVDDIIDDLHGAQPDTEGSRVLYPGERVLETRKESMRKGVTVDTEIWQQVLEM